MEHQIVLQIVDRAYDPNSDSRPEVASQLHGRTSVVDAAVLLQSLPDENLFRMRTNNVACQLDQKRQMRRFMVRTSAESAFTPLRGFQRSVPKSVSSRNTLGNRSFNFC